MRIISFFIRWLFILGILAALTYAVGGQAWMALRLSPFIELTKNLQDARGNITSYVKACQNAPGSSVNSQPIAVQLRFTDDHNYRMELRCTLIESTPVTLETGSLPSFIHKVSGSSGFYVDMRLPSSSEVTLQSLAATKKFTVSTIEQFAPGTSVENSSPATSCVGWGYQCCDANAQKGSGKQQALGVTDCSGNCFAACAPIPYFQGFASDPYPASGNTVRMDTDTLTVTFSYTAAIATGKVSQVHIDFGDGQSADSTEPIGVFTHTYTCSSACANTATITAKDLSGNSSVVNDATTLYIKRI